MTGGIVLAMLLFFGWVFREVGRIQSEKVAMGVIIFGLRNSPSEEIPRLVEMVYWHQRRRTPVTFIRPYAGVQAPSYDDFIIRIQPGPGSTLALLAESPAGRNEGSLILDAAVAKQAGELAAVTARYRKRGVLPGIRNLLPGGPSQSVNATELGQRLFEALFPEAIRELYDRSLGRVETAANHGLRIRLELNPRHRQLARLSALPWELLCRPPQGRFLGLRRLGPIVRSLDAQESVDALPLSLPLRVLVVISSPVDLAQLNLERERRQIEAVWKDHPAVRVTCLERADLEALREGLLQEDYHVLHFMGHSEVDREGTGVLFFETREREGQAVSAKALAGELEDFTRSLRLVVINACLRAHSRTDQTGYDADPSTGVAAALVASGLTSVLALQFAASDSAAVAFSQTLYRRLAAGDPIDTAVTEGRRTLVRMDPDSVDWATPVLYMRSGDGKLLESLDDERPRDSPALIGGLA